MTKKYKRQESYIIYIRQHSSATTARLHTPYIASHTKLQTISTRQKHSDMHYPLPYRKSQDKHITESSHCPPTLHSPTSRERKRPLRFFSHRERKHHKPQKKPEKNRSRLTTSALFRHILSFPFLHRGGLNAI